MAIAFFKLLSFSKESLFSFVQELPFHAQLFFDQSVTAHIDTCEGGALPHQKQNDVKQNENEFDRVAC